MVDSDAYVIHGWVLPWDLKAKDGEEFDSDRDDLLPYVEGHPGAKYTLISDQMCGSYVMFGIQLANAMIPNDFRTYPLREVSQEENEALKAEFARIFSEYLETNIEPHTFMFVHYS